MSATPPTVTVLAGGVGGSKLVRGLAAVLPDDHLTVVVNTADDMTHMGLHVSPDIDTVVHRLAGIHDTERGWGRADESWTVLEHLERLDGPTWFALGDRDLATHLVRTHLLREGATLAEATAHLCKQHEVGPRILPMTNDRVRTIVHTEAGALAFQEWFVARRCEPTVHRLEFAGADTAVPAPGVGAAISRADLVVLAPSNPLLSIDPILAVPGIRAALQRRVAADPIVAVSPIIGGRALRGPAAQLLADLGHDVSATGVAELLAQRLALPDDLPGDGLTAFLGHDDEAPVQVADVHGAVGPIVMHDEPSEAVTARTVVELGHRLAADAHHEVVTVVPVAAPHTAKSRLSEVLNEQQRGDLALDMATRTVAAAARLGPVVVVAQDDATRCMLANAVDDNVVVVTQDTQGLNAAVAQGIAWASRRSDVVLAVPGDLPNVSSDALRTVVAAADFEQGVVVVPDQRDDGTNALVLKRIPHLQPQYGPDSAARHAAAATQIGVEVRVLTNQHLADLDLPEDLATLDPDDLLQRGTT